MQPYIFPYLGYYQLISAVDTFVFFDNVNYIKKGWINKNHILINNSSYKFTLPVKDSSQNKLINEIELSDYNKWCDKFLKTISSSYKKAPQFTPTFNLLTDILQQPHTLVAEVAELSIVGISEFLGFKTIFEKSSSIDYNINAENGEEKILDICRIKKADVYINPYNGKDLYNKDRFSQNHISLNFLRMDDVSYPQFLEKNFVPSLSILDILMFNDKSTVRELINKYILE